MKRRSILLLALLLCGSLIGIVPRVYAAEIPINTSVTISDMDCSNWCFVETKYYTFTATYMMFEDADNLAVGEIAFTDSLTWVNASYTHATTTWALTTDCGNVVNLQRGSATQSVTSTTVTFPIQFERNILDRAGVDIYMRCNATDGETTGWELKAAAYFNIYNLGGLAFVTTDGANAGRAEAADIFAVYAGANSSVRVDQYWKHLKHIGLLINIWIDNVNQWQDGTEEAVDYYWGIDYYYEEAWVEGLMVNLHGPIATSYLQSDHFLTVWNISWYYKGVYLKSGSIASYPFANAVADTSCNTNLFVDIWFNRMNGSTLMGARVGAEYYPMKDTSNAWFRWATGSNWGVDAAHPTHKSGFQELLDSSSEQFSSKKLTFMRVWCNVTQGDNTHVAQMVIWKGIFDANSAQMEGIDTPNQPTVKTPNMPQSTFLGALLSGIRQMINAVTNFFTSILSGWDGFVGFVDSVFAALGWPNGFSIILSWINTFTSWVGEAVDYVIGFLATGLIFVGSLFGYMFDAFMAVWNVLGTAGTWLAWIWDMIAPAWGWVVDVITAVIPLLAIFYVIWLLAPILDRMNFRGTIQRFQSTIGLVLKIVMFIWEVFERLYNMVFRLAEMIPVVE